MADKRAESNAGVVQAAHAEWDYQHTESKYRDGTMAVAIPCQLRFTSDTDQDTQRFHKALVDHGYARVDTDPARRFNGGAPHYDGEVASTDHWKRVKVTVFRGNVVRLYPKDDYVPTEEELAELIAAIEEGFGAELEHDPIDREEDDG